MSALGHPVRCAGEVLGGEVEPEGGEQVGGCRLGSGRVDRGVRAGHPQVRAATPRGRRDRLRARVCGVMRWSRDRWRRGP
ncbi:hypothetical protein LP422_20520 [Janibacter limosus]|uniref:Uncharacterized protein n=1 Tax=Janibacter limosus TaxID=53458 RepID=A0AC61U4A9_9MICO|nr:hypothetical protein [Janibacter limosus]UUZ44673.1 hypothetical protein LP422_20520 [Janibacter limosus]